MQLLFLCHVKAESNIYCKCHSHCIYLYYVCDCFWVGVEELSLKHVVHTKKKKSQPSSTSELLSHASPVPVPYSQRWCILKHQLWLRALVLSILLVHTIFLMSHSSSGALHKFDRGIRGTN